MVLVGEADGTNNGDERKQDMAGLLVGREYKERAEIIALGLLD
ncbi:hypothetical protein [Desulfosarcina cetonica]|nr:hypothetical protein [Desulfosarcina cetonica]